MVSSDFKTTRFPMFHAQVENTLCDASLYPVPAAPPCAAATGVDLTVLLDTSSSVTAAGFAETVEFTQLMVRIPRGMPSLRHALVRLFEFP